MEVDGQRRCEGVGDWKEGAEVAGQRQSAGAGVQTQHVASDGQNWRVQVGGQHGHKKGEPWGDHEGNAADRRTAHRMEMGVAEFEQRDNLHKEHHSFVRLYVGTLRQNVAVGDQRQNVGVVPGDHTGLSSGWARGTVEVVV